MKKTLLFFIIIFLMIGVCGCGMKNQTKVDRMMNYICNKYTDDTFTYEGISGGHLGSNETKIFVSSKLYPETKIQVICTEVDGKEKFRDSYLNIKFEENTYEYIRNSLSEMYGINIYIKYIPDDRSCMSNGSKDTTFEEYISDAETCIFFDAVVCRKIEDEEVELELIKQKFADAVISGCIYYTDSDVDLTQKEVALELVEKKLYSKSLFFVKNTVNEFSSMEWMEGV